MRAVCSAPATSASYPDAASASFPLSAESSQIPRPTTSNTSESSAPFTLSDDTMSLLHLAMHGAASERQPSARDALDGEALEVPFRVFGVEDLAHERVLRIRAGGWGIPELLHVLRAVGGEIDPLGDLLVVDVAFAVPPALHLRQDPDRHRVPGERVEPDAIWHLANLPEPVGELAREHLLDHGQRLIQVVLRRDRLRDLFSILGFRREVRRVYDGLEQRAERVGPRLRELLAARERAARVPIPDLFREQVQEPHRSVDGPLIEPSRLL